MDSHSVCLSGKILILPTFLNDSLASVGMLAWSYSNTLKMPSQLSQWTRLLLKKNLLIALWRFSCAWWVPFLLMLLKLSHSSLEDWWRSRDSVKNTSYGTSGNSLGFKDVDIYFFFSRCSELKKKKDSYIFSLCFFWNSCMDMQIRLTMPHHFHRLSSPSPLCSAWEHRSLLLKIWAELFRPPVRRFGCKTLRIDCFGWLFLFTFVGLLHQTFNFVFKLFTFFLKIIYVWCLIAQQDITLNSLSCRRWINIFRVNS